MSRLDYHHLVTTDDDNGTTFTCDACKGTFEKGWSDEESAAEAGAVFSQGELDDARLVCDPCWRAMRTAMSDLDARYRDIDGINGGALGMIEERKQLGMQPLAGLSDA